MNESEPRTSMDTPKAKIPKTSMDAPRAKIILLARLK